MEMGLSLGDPSSSKKQSKNGVFDFCMALGLKNYSLAGTRKNPPPENGDSASEGVNNDGINSSLQLNLLPRSPLPRRWSSDNGSSENGSAARGLDVNRSPAAEETENSVGYQLFRLDIGGGGKRDFDAGQAERPSDDDIAANNTRKKLRLSKAMNNSPTTALPPLWTELPIDVTANILQRLAPLEILDSAQKVCTTWRSVCCEPSLWRVLDMKYIDSLYKHCIANRVCRHAVDRSQGQLMDISIEYFCSDDLLQYISERSTHLKILTLEYCRSISTRGLTAAVRNLSRLEEFHLFFTPVISYLDIETIGASCPMLNSFTFNDLVQEYEPENIDNRIALSVVKNMPNLRRLRIVGNWLSNEGLLAILDGCSSLELLDLLHCFNVDLKCDLGRRCSQQVKKLRGPFDSTAYCEWDDRVYGIEDEDYGIEDKDYSIEDVGYL